MPKKYTVNEYFTYKCDINQTSRSFTTEKERDQYTKRHWTYCACHKNQYVFDEITYGNSKQAVVKTTKPSKIDKLP